MIINKAKALITVLDNTEIDIRLDGDTGEAHLRQMLKSIIDKSVTDSQAHRWLGYVQGVFVCEKLISVEGLKHLRGAR